MEKPSAGEKARKNALMFVELAEKAFDTWKEKCKDHGETFEKVLTGIKKAIAEVEKSDSDYNRLYETNSWFYVECIARDVLDDLMAVLYRDQVDGDLKEAYFALPSREDTIAHGDLYANNLKSLDEKVDTAKTEYQTAVAEFVKTNEAGLAYKKVAEEVATERQAMAYFTSLARGAVDSIEDAKEKAQKQAEQQQAQQA